MCWKLTIWCVEWEKWMNVLVELERSSHLIESLGKDGSHCQLRKQLSHYGGVRWSVLEDYSVWPLKQYIRWQCPQGHWYVDCGNEFYAEILGNKCGLLWTRNNPNIAYALMLGNEK